jgi:nitroreductase
LDKCRPAVSDEEATRQGDPGWDRASVDHVLGTTRAVRRRLDFDRPVPREVLLECVELAQQAPTGGNRQGWRFLIVTDQRLRNEIADVYRKASLAALQHQRDNSDDDQTRRVYGSAVFLAENLHRVPVHVFPCVQVARTPDGVRRAGASGSDSIIQAAWSFMLALRARGLGSTWTSISLARTDRLSTLLGIPDDFRHVALLPVAYTLGSDFRRAARPPATSITYWDTWGESS